MRELAGAQALAAALYFAVRRRWYRLRYPRLTIGSGVMFIGRLRLRQGTELVLGDRARIRGRVIINGGGRVEVGADTLLNGCWIVAGEAVVIGERCLVSDCGISDSDFHNVRPDLRHVPPLPATRAPIRVGTNVWLGAHALVLKGTTVGADSVVAAGAVVRGEVPHAVIVAGNPAAIVHRFGGADR